MESGNLKQHVTLRCRASIGVIARPALGPISVIMVLLLGAAGCASQNPDAYDRLPDIEPTRALAQPAPGGPACGLAQIPQPLEVSGLGDAEVRDRQLTDRITKYLNDHCLPLVRASITSHDDYEPTALLYGFVGSDFDKGKAEEETAELLANTGIEIDDAIMVRPQLASGSAPPANIPDAANDVVVNDSAEYDDSPQVMVIPEYANHNRYGFPASLPPTAGLGVAGGAIGAGSAVFVTPGSRWYPGIAPAYAPPYGAALRGAIGPAEYPVSFPPLP